MAYPIGHRELWNNTDHIMNLHIISANDRKLNRCYVQLMFQRHKSQVAEIQYERQRHKTAGGGGQRLFFPGYFLILKSLLQTINYRIRCLLHIVESGGKMFCYRDQKAAMWRMLRRNRLLLIQRVTNHYIFAYQVPVIYFWSKTLLYRSQS